jgi:uncharacterized membrane protein YkoI
MRPATTGPCQNDADRRLLIHVSNMSGRLRHDEMDYLVSQSMRSCRTLLAFATVLAAATLVAAAPRLADADDQDRSRRDEVRRAVESGEIRSLADILSGLRGKLPGEIAGVEIEHKGRWRYEFRVVDSQGRLFDVYVDPRSGEIERIKEK